jgi:hypothetical protein
MITLDNINKLQEDYSIIKKQRVHGSNNKTRYKLLNDLNIELSNGIQIWIYKGFVWDASSTPRFLWWLLPPEGDFELAALVHDYLYVHKLVSRKQADKEMLIWSKKTNSTTKISLKNIDNLTRYYGVRTFGWLVWKKWIIL